METEFVAYLKSSPGFTSLMQKLKEQYQRLGRFGGRIEIIDPTSEERAMLGSLLGVNFHDEVSFTTTKLLKAIEQSRYDGVNLKKVVELYFDQQLLSNQETKAVKQQQQDQFFTSFMDDSPAASWLSCLLEEKKYGYQTLIKLYHQDRNNLQEVLQNIFIALNNLPDEATYLSLFAAKCTGDPHYFDLNTTNFNLFFEGLCFHQKISSKDIANIDRYYVLYQAGILIDDISNYVYVCHLASLDHQGWWGFYQRYEVMSVTLMNLRMIKAITPTIKRVYIIENPGVFSILSSFAKDQKLNDVGFVCTNGQLNLTGYLLLDMIEEADLEMYYCGDFDPEGLMIADKLVSRYPCLQLWHYQLDDFEVTKTIVAISKRRLTSLNKLKDHQLQIIRNAIILSNCIGYQELLVERYLDDLV